MTLVFDERKLFAGAKLRRLRQEHSLSQTAMAGQLGVSVSYLNLIERNQRPLTANVLLRLASAFDMDLRSLMEAEKGLTEEGLSEIFGDPVLSGIPVSRGEVQDLIATAPNAARALERLYALHRETLRREEGAPFAPKAEAGVEIAIEEVRDILAERRNHFPELETVAERIHEELAPAQGQLAAALLGRLQARHRIKVRVLPGTVMGGLLRSFDPHRRTLNLSDLLEAPSRLFQMAFQLVAIEAVAAVDAIASTTSFAEERGRRLYRLALINYAAAALMMPYARFLKAAEELSYDIDLVGQRFDASFEQVAHRLTTLQRVKNRGVPFFMVRVDAAGNISKRFTSGGFPFSRYGGTCPLWNVHKAFEAPGRILTQIVELPGGERYFSIARTVRRALGPWGGPESVFAVALGCDVKAAERLVYAQGLDLRATAVPIGVNCRLCPRSECPQRAAPLSGRDIRDSELVKTVSPFGFVS
jgi:XRE family transcriptional regulator, fatty acid utilization regulator